jgi:hypothetical protein
MKFGAALTILVGCNTQRPYMGMMEESSSSSTSGVICKRGIFSMEPSFVANKYLEEFTKLQEEGQIPHWTLSYILSENTYEELGNNQKKFVDSTNPSRIWLIPKEEYRELRKAPKSFANKALQLLGDHHHALIFEDSDLDVLNAEIIRDELKIVRHRLDAPQFVNKGLMHEVTNRYQNTVGFKNLKLIESLEFNNNEPLSTIHKKSLSFLRKQGYEMIMKPKSEASSTGVSIFSTSQGGTYKHLEDRLKDCLEIHQSNINEFIFQSFIPGRVFRLDGYISNGKVISAFLNHDFPNPIEYYQHQCTEIQISDNSEQVVSGKTIGQEICDAFNYQNGIFHIEFIRVPHGEQKDDIFFLEIAVRPGGLFNMFPHYPYPFQRVHLLSMLGEQLPENPDPVEEEFATVHFCPLNPRSHGLNQILLEDIDLPEVGSIIDSCTVVASHQNFKSLEENCCTGLLPRAIACIVLKTSDRDLKHLRTVAEQLAKKVEASIKISCLGGNKLSEME